MDDMSGCRLCLDAVAQEGRWLSRLRAAPVERYAAFWASLCEVGAPQTVAVDGMAVVGWCDIIPDTSSVRAHVGNLGMGVLASYRGQGLGRHLLTQTLVRARELGLERVELSVLHDNVAAYALYERLGFLVEGQRKHDWKHEGVYRDSLLMALSIVPR
jgi:ribosomal protein S18 acetylase RimI-like enzyme